MSKDKIAIIGNDPSKVDIEAALEECDRVNVEVVRPHTLTFHIPPSFDPFNPSYYKTEPMFSTRELLERAI